MDGGKIGKDRIMVKSFALRLLQLSDLHITSYRDLLSPMIDSINREDVDLVIVTGDTVSSNDRALYQVASNKLNKIRHRVVVTTGDYDNGSLWGEYFGSNRFSSIRLNGFCIDLLDTSFMKHRFADGWADTLAKEDPEQDAWIKEQLKDNKYHILFSHHPFWVNPTKAGDVYITNTLRAVFSGHLHAPVKFYYSYDKPLSDVKNGFACVPLNFHGNSCYMLISVKPNGEMVNTPRIVNSKITAW